jgi:solute carrier family 25 carnitine/acylcarnitine transporter 20/29
MLTPTTVRSVALQLYQAHGIPGLYRGLTATVLRDCGYGAYFFAVS